MIFTLLYVKRKKNSKKFLSLLSLFLLLYIICLILKRGKKFNSILYIYKRKQKKRGNNKLKFLKSQMNLKFKCLKFYFRLVSISFFLFVLKIKRNHANMFEFLMNFQCPQYNNVHFSSS